MTRDELLELEREDLNALAEDKGIENPKRFKNKGEVADAILAAEAKATAEPEPEIEDVDEEGPDSAPETPEEGDEGADTGESDSAAPGADNEAEDEPEPEPEPLAPGLIRVKGTERGRVSFFERDARHPHGEAWITGEAEGVIFATSAAYAAIGQGRLVLI